MRNRIDGSKAALMLAAAIWIVASALGVMRKASVDVEIAQTAHQLATLARSAVVDTTWTGYSVLLSVLARLTPGTLAGLDCLRLGACTIARVPFIIASQVLAAFACVAIVYRMAHILSGAARVALLATILAFLSMRLGEFAGSVRQSIWFALICLVHVWMLLAAHARHSRAAAAAAGAAALLAVLFEPTAAVLIVIAPLLLVALRGIESTPWQAVGLAAATVVGALLMYAALWLVAAPALAPALLARKAGQMLAQRSAFAGLEQSTWLAALIVPVPWVGDLVATMLPTAEIKKLSVGVSAGSLVRAGLDGYAPLLVRAGGDAGLALAMSMHESMLARPLTYLRSLAPLTARGLFAGGGIIALLGVLHVPLMVRHARADATLRRHLVVLLPALALLIANVLLTSNEFWLNPLLPFVYAYALAYVAGGW